MQLNLNGIIAWSASRPMDASRGYRFRWRGTKGEGGWMEERGRGGVGFTGQSGRCRYA